MCAQFGIVTDEQLLSRQYGVEVPQALNSLLNKRFLPYAQAPVLVAGSGALAIQPMSFSLVPSWSKTPKVKFATHNARLETIAEKPTWKKPFLSQRCLVPMTYFVEPIYEGPHAGFMVRFFEKSESFLTAAGIWDQWLDQQSGELVESFSIITDEPPPYIDDMGHDRCPVFLKQEGFAAWVEPVQKKASDLKALLRDQRASIEFSVANDRAMRPGWEKRK